MTIGEKPQYLSQSDLARHFDVSRAAIANWYARWPCDHAVLPTPEPDAFVGGKPLWLQESLPKWDAWREQHLRRWGGRMEHPGPPKKKVQVIEKLVVGVSEAEAAENQQALCLLLRQLHARAGWPTPRELAVRTGVVATTIRTALKGDKMPDRPTVVALAKALGGDPEMAADLWARSRPARLINGGWFSRVLSVVHGRVLQLAAEGATAEVTAETLGWTVDGVHSFWDDITERLRVQSMDEAVRIAFETGYLVARNGVIVIAGKPGGGPEKQGGEHGYLIYKVAHDLRTKLANAEPGSRVGTIDQLRAEFQTSATTIFYALRILKAEGVIAGGGKGHPLIVAER